MSPRELLASLPEGATPGPWRAEMDGGPRGAQRRWRAIDSDTRSVVRPDWYERHSGGETETVSGTAIGEADAALIAAAPALRDALAEVLAENERLRELISEAATIITDFAPGYDVWMRAASIATATGADDA